MAAEATPTGGARVVVTLLAAGFILGPSGVSVREICKVTCADCQSFTSTYSGRRCRVFTVEVGGRVGGCARRCGCWWVLATAPASARLNALRPPWLAHPPQGHRKGVVRALELIAAAVARYNELCGGAYCGQAVDRAQTIDLGQGVACNFYYRCAIKWGCGCWAVAGAQHRRARWQSPLLSLAAVLTAAAPLPVSLPP